MKKILSTLILLVGTASLSSAALVVNQVGGTPPTENVVYSQYREDGQAANNYIWRWRTAADPVAEPPVVSDRRDIGQLFSVESPMSISALGIYLGSASQNSSAPRPFTLSIIKASGLTAGGGMQASSTITVLETLNGALPSVGSGNQYLEFSFEETPVFLDTIESDSSYGFLLAFDNAIPQGGSSDTGNYMFFQVVAGAEHTGFMITYNGSTPVISPNHPNVPSGYGMNFYVQGTPIPEAETAVAMAGVFLLLIVFVRRIRKS